MNTDLFYFFFQQYLCGGKNFHFCWYFFEKTFFYDFLSLDIVTFFVLRTSYAKIVTIAILSCNYIFSWKFLIFFSQVKSKFCIKISCYKVLTGYMNIEISC